MTSTIFAVVTTINEPREYVQQYLDLGIQVVVVADAKTPHWPENDKTKRAIHFLSLEYQDAAYPELSKLIGLNKYQRKNLGYLYAAAAGATAIVDTDDDTYPIFQSGEDLLRIDGHWTVQTPSLVWNPYSFFMMDEQRSLPKTWPRGFPLSQLDRTHLEDNLLPYSSKPAHVDVIQCLIAGHPDIDSIQRLCNGLINYDCLSHETTVLPAADTWFTGNTQSSVWLNTRKFDYLFIPPSVGMRFCDVLRTYIAQTSCSFAHKGFLFKQQRNIHSLYQDFVAEQQLFQATEIIYHELVKPNFRPSNQKEVYAALRNLGLVTELDMEALNIFSRILVSNTRSVRN